MNDLNNSVIFPKGDKVDNQYFIGDVWVEMLVDEPEFNCPTYNVTFAPGARNNWHIHPGGQILLVTGGNGFYQEYGQPVRIIKTGDVVKIPIGIKHWHGATADSWMTHVGITANPQLGEVEWLEAVDELYYQKI